MYQYTFKYNSKVREGLEEGSLPKKVVFTNDNLHGKCSCLFTKGYSKMFYMWKKRERNKALYFNNNSKQLLYLFLYCVPPRGEVYLKSLLNNHFWKRPNLIFSDFEFNKANVLNNQSTQRFSSSSKTKSNEQLFISTCESFNSKSMGIACAAGTANPYEHLQSPTFLGRFVLHDH